MASLSFDPTETSALFSGLIAVMNRELATQQQLIPVFHLGDFGQGFTDIAQAVQTQAQLLHAANLQHITRLVEATEAAQHDVYQLVQLDAATAHNLGGL